MRRAHEPPVADPAPTAGDAASESALSSWSARRRALLAAGCLLALLALLWLGDVLSGFVPRGAYHPAAQTAGAVRVTLLPGAATPTAGVPDRVVLRVATASGQPLTGATVTYQWIMTTMDMGTVTGTATPDATPGAYDLTVTALMSGYWRLLVTVRAPGLVAGVIAFDIPER